MNIYTLSGRFFVCIFRHVASQKLLKIVTHHQTTPACYSLAASRASCEANRESSHSHVSSLVEWVSQEGLVCKCVRKGGQGKRTSISQLIGCRFYYSPGMKQASIQHQSGPREPLTHCPPVHFRWTLVFMWGVIGPGPSLCHNIV